MRRLAILALPFLAGLLVWAAPGRAQGPSLAGPQKAPPPPDSEPYQLRVAVELVTAPLVVRQVNGDFIYDLTRDEVTLFDNGIPQRLTSFELATQPLSVVILVDTSQRVAPLLDRVRKTGILFSSYILGQFGEAAVISFDDEATLRQEFTSDADQLIRTLEKLPAGGHQSRLADGLDQAVRLLLERPEERRRVIIVLSEAFNSGSTTPIGRPLRWAQLAGISVYTIALSALEADLRRRPEETPVRRSPYPPGVFPGPPVPGQPQTPTTEAQARYARVDLMSAITTLVRTLRDAAGQDVLELYAQGTGGLHYSTLSQSALEDTLNHIGQDLHNQYLLTYRPSTRDQGGFHRIEVRLSRPGVVLRTRPGYYLGPPL